MAIENQTNDMNKVKMTAFYFSKSVEIIAELDKAKVIRSNK